MRAIPSHPVARMALLRQFLQFGTVGASGVLVDVAVVYALRGWIGPYAAACVSYVLAATWNWWLNRLWTFRGRSTGARHTEWARFIVANLAGFALNRGTYAVLISLSALCYAHPEIAIVAGTAMGMFVNFHLSRKMVFR